MKPTTIYLVSVDAVHFASEEELSAHVQSQRVDPAKFIAVPTSGARRLHPQIALLPMGEPAPKKERTPVDSAARDALDAKVHAFLVGRAPHASLEQVATCNSITKPEATAALQRLKKAGTVHSPGRNQWAAKAKEASAS